MTTVLKPSLLALMAVLCLAACGDFKPIVYKDTVILQDFGRDGGAIYGLRGLWVLYGVYKTDKADIPAGQCILVDPPGRFTFSIKEFLIAEPQFADNPDIQKAAEK